MVNNGDQVTMWGGTEDPRTLPKLLDIRTGLVNSNIEYLERGVWLSSGHLARPVISVYGLLGNSRCQGLFASLLQALDNRPNMAFLWA